MTTWVLNTVGLLATTTGALIVFLHLHRTARASDNLPSPEGAAASAKDRRLLVITMGLMAVWFVIQYVALILT
jgi:hypothetical protein